MSEQQKKRRRANANLPHWPTSNTYFEKVVGESFYTDCFEALYEWPKNCERTLYALATLTPDPDNQYDTKAVKVIVEGRHVGHLSRQSALLYKEKVVDNLEVYDPPLSTACIRIERLIFDGEVKYSAALDLKFDRPPSDINKEHPRSRYSTSLPLLRPHCYVESGFLVFLSPNMDQYAMERAYPGTDLDVWQPPDSEDIFMYVKSSMGGGGKVAVTDMPSLKRIGFTSLDDFHPVIHSAAGDVIIVCAELPKPQ